MKNYCPKCMAELKEEINLVGYIFRRQKRITIYCPLCNFSNVKIFKINEAEHQALLDKMRDTYY